MVVYRRSQNLGGPKIIELAVAILLLTLKSRRTTINTTVQQYKLPYAIQHTAYAVIKKKLNKMSRRISKPFMSSCLNKTQEEYNTKHLVSRINAEGRTKQYKEVSFLFCVLGL